MNYVTGFGLTRPSAGVDNHKMDFYNINIILILYYNIILIFVYFMLQVSVKEVIKDEETKMNVRNVSTSEAVILFFGHRVVCTVFSRNCNQ